MTDIFHLAVSWDWEYDADFVRILEESVHTEGLRFYSISHHNTLETARRVQKNELRFGAFLDRAPEAEEHFPTLAKAIRRTGAFFINHPDALIQANDKATMHLEFLTAGIQVPFTIIISPYNKKRELELSLSDLAKLGRPFIIKPANTTGGGIGVVRGAESLKDVIESRQHHKNDKYLLQEKIVATRLGDRMAWFRVFWIFGRIIPCWWDDETHIYAPVDRTENGNLEELVRVTGTIARVCKLDFFSTEIALTAEGKFVAVDYVNDICDMRLQSRFPNGVPDPIVREICSRIALQLRVTQPPSGTPATA